MTTPPPSSVSSRNHDASSSRGGGPPSSSDDAPTSARSGAAKVLDVEGEPIKIEVHGLKASFGETEVLHGVDFRLPTHSITALIGPSGSGKSTFLRCLNRMHEMTPGASLRGQVLLDGEDVYASGSDAVSVRRRVGIVFQKPNPFPSMTVRENVLAGPRLNGTLASVASPDELVERSLRAASLWSEVRDQLDAAPTRLSVGQQQRLCIARALAVAPEVLLMDEPCSVLDPIETAHIEELVVSLRARYTILFVTHSMQQAARLSAHTGFFLHGQLIELGRTDQMFRSPRHRETEDYITGKFG